MIFWDSSKNRFFSKLFLILKRFVIPIFHDDVLHYNMHKFLYQKLLLEALIQKCNW